MSAIPRTSDEVSAEWPLTDGELPGGAYVRFGTFGRSHRLHCRLRGPVRSRALTRLWADLFCLEHPPPTIVIDLLDADVQITTAGAAASMRLVRSLASRGSYVVLLGADPAVQPFLSPADEGLIHLAVVDRP